MKNTHDQVIQKWEFSTTIFEKAANIKQTRIQTLNYSNIICIDDEAPPAGNANWLFNFTHCEAEQRHYIHRNILQKYEQRWLQFLSLIKMGSGLANIDKPILYQTEPFKDRQSPFSGFETFWASSIQKFVFTQFIRSLNGLIGWLYSLRAKCYSAPW